MAWERFEVGGFSGMCGDQPMDQITLCLTRIAAIYERRYARKPYYAELLYCLEIILSSEKSQYTSDEGDLDDQALLRNIPIPNLVTVDPEHFEAMSEEDEPDEYVIFRVASTNIPTPKNVVRVHELTIEDGVLRCVYSVLDHSLSVAAVKPLVRRAIVERLLGEDYTALVSEEYIQRES